jgi:hypothetical protein
VRHASAGLHENGTFERVEATRTSSSDGGPPHRAKRAVGVFGEPTWAPGKIAYGLRATEPGGDNHRECANDGEDHPRPEGSATAPVQLAALVLNHRRASRPVPGLESTRLDDLVPASGGACTDQASVAFGLVDEAAGLVCARDHNNLGRWGLRRNNHRRRLGLRRNDHRLGCRGRCCHFLRRRTPECSCDTSGKHQFPHGLLLEHPSWSRARPQTSLAPQDLATHGAKEWLPALTALKPRPRGG